MMDLTIGEIALAVGGQLFVQGANADAAVSSVVLDSRLVEPRCVFLATVGERVDGHRFIGDVFEKGVSLVITEKTPEQVFKQCNVEPSTWGTYLLVKDSFQALKDLGEFYRSKLTIPIVGITGSVGKTSTKEFVAGVLAQKYHVLKTEGNYNNEIGVPLTLLKIRPEHTAAVVEMGISEFGEMHRLSKMARPDICVITNIGQCHLENLKTRDGILQAKTEILDYMSKDGKVCFWGEDDKLTTKKTVRRGACLEDGGADGEPYFFGLGENPEECVWAEQIVSRGLFGSDAVLAAKKADGSVERYSVQIPLPGKHMVINAAAAACVAGLLGLTSEEITKGLAGLKATKGRGQLHSLGGRTIIDDCYNANPVSMCAAIDLLTMAEGEKVALLGDMFELGEDSDKMHAGVGAYAAAAGIQTILCVGENAKHMYEAAVDAAQEQMVTRENFPEQKIYWVETPEKLMGLLAQEEEAYLPEGSTVLLKASHGMHFEKILEMLKEKPE